MQLSASQILSLFEYKDARQTSGTRVWILGSADKNRVTVLSQQHRAISLIDSIFEANRAQPNQKFGIIGGGVAGLTAAAAVLKKKGNVTLFEKGNLLGLFEEASHRWLHPGLFNWPQPQWTQPHTELPFLNWSFDSAQNVAKRIIEQFRIITSFFANGDRYSELKKEMVLHEFHEGRPTVRDSTGLPYCFDHLIVATGFGLERSIADTQSYWKPDNIDSQGGKFTVVGTGDGGLIDALRIRLVDFSENAIINGFFCDWDKVERTCIEQKILEFESDTRRTLSANSISQFYSSLKTSNAEEWMRRKLRADTSLRLLGRQPAACTDRAAALNRFLFSLLQKVDNDHTVYKQATFRPGERHDDWTIKLAEDSIESSSTIEGKLICRTGQASALKRFSAEIHDYC